MITVNKLIEVLNKVKESGYGESLVFLECFDVSGDAVDLDEVALCNNERIKDKYYVKRYIRLSCCGAKKDEIEDLFYGYRGDDDIEE